MKEFLIRKSSNLQEIKKNKKDFVLLTPHLIIKGEIEVFLMDDNYNIIKIDTRFEKDFIIGPFLLLSKLLKKYNVKLFYKSNSDVLLKKISQNTMQEIFKDTKKNNLYFQIMIKRIIDTYYYFFLRNTSKSRDHIKILLEKECKTSNIIELDNVSEFVKKYRISRSIFYKEIKKIPSSFFKIEVV